MALMKENTQNGGLIDAILECSRIRHLEATCLKWGMALVG